MYKSFQAIFKILPLFLFALISCKEEGDPCQRIDCSGHGSCYSEGSLVWCECEQGFLPSGLNCVEEVGDADLDTSETDSDHVADGDADSDTDDVTDADDIPDADGDAPEVLFFEDFEDGLEGWFNLNPKAVWVWADGIVTSGVSCWPDNPPNLCDEGIAVLVSEEIIDLPEDGRYTIEFDFMTDYTIENRSIVELILQNGAVPLSYKAPDILNLDRQVQYFLDTRFSATGNGHDLFYLFHDREGRAECWNHDWNYEIGTWYHIRLGMCAPEGYILEISRSDSDEILHTFSNFHFTTPPDDAQTINVVFNARGERKNIDNVRITAGCTWHSYESTSNCPWL